MKAVGGESALGVTGGAGIGSGENADYTGTVTIHGGVVYAVGGADALSIGGGGRSVGDSENGTFTTGSGGNAVIVAPQGIGHVAGYPDWDGIFVSYNGQESTATVGADGAVHLNDSTATIEIWGQPVLDYDLAVEAGTTFVVRRNDRNDAPRRLPFPPGTRWRTPARCAWKGNARLFYREGAPALNNTGVLRLDSGVVELWGGPAQATGRRAGDWHWAGAHPLTADMVQAIPDQTYTGSAIEPGVVILPQTMWNFTAHYASPADYTVTGYENNTNAGTATAKATPASGGQLLNKGEVRKNFEIAPTSYTMAVTDTLRVREGESDLLTKLNALASTGPEGVLGQGTLSWTYNGQPVQANTLAGEPVGGPIR